MRGYICRHEDSTIAGADNIVVCEATSYDGDFYVDAFFFVVVVVVSTLLSYFGTDNITVDG